MVRRGGRCLPCWVSAWGGGPGEDQTGKYPAGIGEGGSIGLPPAAVDGEDLRVAGGVAELHAGDLGEGVARLDDHLPVGGVGCVSGEEEAPAFLYMVGLRPGLAAGLRESAVELPE